MNVLPNLFLCGIDTRSKSESLSSGQTDEVIESLRDLIANVQTADSAADHLIGKLNDSVGFGPVLSALKDLFEQCPGALPAEHQRE